MYTAPCQNTGLPNTLALACLVSTVFHSGAPSRSESASRRGAPDCATGTNTAGPPGACRSIADEPLIGWPTCLDQRTLPVAASSAYTVPPLSPATSTPPGTTGVAVKSPVGELNFHAC